MLLNSKKEGGILEKEYIIFVLVINFLLAITARYSTVPIRNKGNQRKYLTMVAYMTGHAYSH